MLSAGARHRTCYGFFEHAHHLLDVAGPLKLGQAVRHLNEGRTVIGQCPAARLPDPVYETAFASAKRLRENGNPNSVMITVVCPGSIEAEFGDEKVAALVQQELLKHGIELVSRVPISRIGSSVVTPSGGNRWSRSRHSL